MNKIFDDKWKKKPTKKELYDLIDCYTKEIKRLNNIINELEKEIKWQRKISLSLNSYGVSVCDILLHKLQELKGSDKE